MAQITNQAQLSYNGEVVNSNIVVGQVLEVISVNKTALIGSYEPESTITFVVNILNSGNTAYTGLTVTDNLGAYSFGTPPATRYPLTYVDSSATLFINGVSQAAPTVTAGPPLVFTGINIPAGATATLVYDAKVNQYAPLIVASEIKNTVSVSGGGLSAPVTAEETISSVDTPVLSIIKSMAPIPVTENGVLTYTFTIENYGNTSAEAGDNVRVIDTFSPILSALTAELDGAPLTVTTDYTYDAATGQFATVAGIITVPAATYTQAANGIWSVTPGITILKVSGTV